MADSRDGRSPSRPDDDNHGPRDSSTTPLAEGDSQTQTPHASAESAPRVSTEVPPRTATSPGRVSSCSLGSDKHTDPRSAASDISTDRVFPIRSVVSVDPSHRGPVPCEDYFQGQPDAETRAIPYHRLGNSRRETSPIELRRPDPFSPMSAASGYNSDYGARMRRKRAMSGPFSSIQADAARQGNPGPLNLSIFNSDDESPEPSLHRRHRSNPSAPRLDSPSTASGQRDLTDMPHVTTRFTHVETEDGHAVITGRDGVLQQCEDEPIHTPGAIQGFGVLLALREETDGSFAVRYVSENSERLLGYSPRQLFRLKSFMDVLTEEQQDNLLDHIDFIRDEDADPALNGPEVLSLSVRQPKKAKTVKLWCAIHINPAHPELVICEFELDDDLDYPLRPTDDATPDTPYDTLHSNPTLEEMEQSTEILSKPLRILRSARKRRGNQGAMQVFDIMSQVQEQLASAPNLDVFLKVLVGIVKELTGFHRVMIYQFDASYNGKVVTELVDAAQTLDLYMGLHFPASDIPRQARDLYKINKVRLLYDRDLESARIVCRTAEDLDVPLDMTHAYLRSMSPIHRKYLANMAVRSSMSISINAFDELWGLIACHSYGDQGMRVSFPIRKMCRLVGDTASRNIERLSYASRLQVRKLINTVPTDKNPSGYIIASSDDLLKLFDADCGLLSIRDETKVLGTLENSQEALAMLEYLRMRRLTSVLTSQDIRADFPDLRYPPGFQVIAGLLYVPLSVGGNDFIVFFRRGQIKEVKWAGNPYEKQIRDGTSGYLEPRKSFKTWSETVVGKCREWIEEQIETAAVLCLVYGKFIEVWRQKEAALQNSKLTRLLLANSAHEVRTPLNAIINYLEIALEGSLDHETRDNLARSHSASKSLIYVINDLLDLTKTEEGQNLVKDEIFDLPGCIREATDPFQVDAKRKGIEYRVSQHEGLPQFVHGDSSRVRRAISNITANAVAHTHRGSVQVETYVSEVKDQKAIVDIVVADSGVGMSAQQLDALFRELEQVSSEETEPEGSVDEKEGSTKSRTLGLGLAVVARILRNMDGQLRLKSEEGQGSRFVIQLPFCLPDPSPAGESIHATSLLSHASNPVAAPDSMKTTPEGEIMLIDRGVATNLVEEVGTSDKTLDEASSGTQASVQSLGSRGRRGSRGSHESDADRLINAIQTPFALDENQKAATSGYFPNQSDSRSHSSKTPSRTGAGGGSFHPRSPEARNMRIPSPRSVRGEPGTADVRDSKTPLRAIKVPEEYHDMPAPGENAAAPSGVLFEIPSRSGGEQQGKDGGGQGASTRKAESTSIRTLIAEDDPINVKILRKRLERAGHEVQHAVNGEDCARLYKENSSSFDAILMDMQMPIVDGLTSTKMIRSIEGSADHNGYSEQAALNGRVPIFAVSASLVESEKQTYMDAGFDGWILKPIDFKRLNTLFEGISDSGTRRSCLYVAGQWERGGWFAMRKASEGGGRGSSADLTPRGEDGL